MTLRDTIDALMSINYISSRLDSSTTSKGIDGDRTSVCAYLTGVPVGYCSDICTTKVSQRL